MHAALPSDHDDHNGGIARRASVGAGHRSRLGVTASAGNYHCWRAHLQPSADAFHHARGLFVYGPVALTHAESICSIRAERITGRLIPDSQFAKIWTGFIRRLLPIRDERALVVVPLTHGTQRGPWRPPLRDSA